MPAENRFLNDLYGKGRAGAGLKANAIVGGAANKLPDDALPDDVLQAETTGLTHSDAGSVGTWRQAETDSEGTIDFAMIIGPDGTAATYDPAAGEIKVPGQFTDDEAAEARELFKDIRARGFANIVGARVSAVNGRGNVPYNNQQARTYQSWRANGSLASNQGTASENRNFLIETEREYAVDDPKFRVVTITDGELSDTATLTAQGTNAAGDRYYYNANFARIAAGGNSLLSVQYDLPTELDNVVIHANQVEGVFSLDQLPPLGNLTLIEGAGIGASYLGQDLYGPLHLFSPAFDLDDPNKQHGYVSLDFTLSLVTSSLSVSTIRLTENAELSYRFDGTFSTANLRSAVAYAANATRGNRVGRVEVYASTVHIATITLFLSYAAATNQLGYYWHVDSIEAGYTFTFILQANAYYAQGSGSVALENIFHKAAASIENQANADLPDARTFLGRVAITPRSTDRRLLINLIGGQLTWTANVDARFALYRMPNATSTSVTGATYLAEFVYNPGGAGTMPVSQAYLHSPSTTTEVVYAVFMNRSAAGVRINAADAAPLILTAEEIE